LSRNLFVIACAFVILQVETSILPRFVGHSLRPDLGAPLVIWAALRTKFVFAAFFAFVFGALTDLMSGSPIGLSSVVYCLVMMGAVNLDAIVRANQLVSALALVFLSGLLTAALVVVVRLAAGAGAPGWAMLSEVFLKSISTTLCAAPVLAALEGVGNRRRSSNSGL
jgi:rod shape-determining protein MreD